MHNPFINAQLPICLTIHSSFQGGKSWVVGSKCLISCSYKPGKLGFQILTYEQCVNQMSHFTEAVVSATLLFHLSFVVSFPFRDSGIHGFFSLAHLLQTGLHVLQLIISYFLMLIVMTYNVYLCLAVVLGAGLGYFLFFRRRFIMLNNLECCHWHVSVYRSNSLYYGFVLSVYFLDPVFVLSTWPFFAAHQH